MAPLIFKLPNEILLNIAAYADEEMQIQYYDLQRDMSPVAILKFSMTCRRFREISAHLLVPEVTVDFQHSSLARLEEIASHPSIGKGVRLVKVCLRFFSRELCDDFNKFVEFYVEELKTHISSNAGSRSKVTALHNGKGYRESGRVLDSWTRVAEKISDSSYNFGDVDPEDRSNWRRFFNQDVEDRIHYDLFKRAHDQHKSLYAEQESLFESGEFVCRVAAAMARMPRAKGLEIWDTSPFHEQIEYWDIPVRPGVDVWDAYYQPMVSSLYPTIIHLPIALHNAGVSVHGVHIYLDGLQQDDIFQCDGPTLTALTVAVQKVKVFDFNGCPYINAVSRQSMKHLPTVMVHLISNPNLKRLNLDICGMENRHIIDITSDAWPKLPGSCLTLTRKLPRKQLTRVNLFRAKFRCCEMLAFLASLPAVMRDIHMEDVQLLDGTWEEVIDMLRKKKYASEYGVRLTDCSGGEQIHMTIPQNQTFFTHDWDAMEHNYLEMYCMRMVKTNPLLAFRTREWNEEKFLKEEVDA